MFGGMAPGKGEKMLADYKNKGLNLLKKGQKGIVHAIFSRFGLVLMLLILQVLILLSIFQWLEEFLPHIFGGAFHIHGIFYCG